MGVVKCTTYIGVERVVTHCVVVAAIYVVKQGEHSNGRVERAGSVAEKPCSANGRILVCSVEKQCAGADACVEAGRSVA